MAGRIRTLKPEWLEDEKLMTLSVEARLLSVAVLLLADDHGRGRAHPAHLAASVFPVDEEGVPTAKRALAELVSAGYVRTYLVRGQTYYEVVNWRKHQRVDKPGAPRVPGPDEAEASGNVEKPPVANDSRIIPESVANDSGDIPSRLATDLRSPITISDQDHDPREPEPRPAPRKVPLVEPPSEPDPVVVALGLSADIRGEGVDLVRLAGSLRSEGAATGISEKRLLEAIPYALEELATSRTDKPTGKGATRFVLSVVRRVGRPGILEAERARREAPPAHFRAANGSEVDRGGPAPVRRNGWRAPE